MNILYLAHRIPYPPNKGDKIRSFNEIKYLAVNNTVDLICLADDPDDLQYKEALQKYCRKVFVHPISKVWGRIKGLMEFCLGKPISTAYFYRKEVQRTVNQWLGSDNYDVLICFSSSVAEYIFRSEYLKRAGKEAIPKRPKLIMDFCDVDSDKWLQYSRDANFPLKQIYRAENKRMQEYEKKVYRSFDSTFVVSDLEKETFLKYYPDGDDLVVIKNGVDTEYFSPDHKLKEPVETKNPSLVFIGAMDYHANVEGVCWFCREIFSDLLATNPDLQFYIVGRDPAPVVKKLAALQGVHVIGDVADVRPWYQTADVFVVPLRLGRGVQNKVLEAMAMGKPVVSTSRANAGVSANDNEHLLLGDSAAGFANAVRMLLQDNEKRKLLGHRARNFVLAEYDWNINMAKLESLLT